jgi:hypothetical protein
VKDMQKSQIFTELTDLESTRINGANFHKYVYHFRTKNGYEYYGYYSSNNLNDCSELFSFSPTPEIPVPPSFPVAADRLSELIF